MLKRVQIFHLVQKKTVIIFDTILFHSASLISVLVSKEIDLNILKMMLVPLFPVAYDLKINGSLISKQICFGET